MRSLRWSLVLALVLVAWLSVATVGLLTARLTAERFGQFLMHSRGMGRMPGMPGMHGMPDPTALPAPPMIPPPPMLGVPERRFLADARAAVWFAALAGLLVAAAVGTVTARRITAPLQALAAAARRIGAGDLRASGVPRDRSDEIGELARTFDAMAEQLAQSEDARRRLLADIAHELGTPLTAVQANLEGMLDGVIEPSPERIASLHTQIQVLARLVHDLRDLSLAQQGRLPLDRGRVDLAALVREVAEMSRPVAEDRGITLDVQGDGAVQALGDRDRLIQVVHNLVSNALRYTPSGGRVLIRAGTSPAGATSSSGGPAAPVSSPGAPVAPAGEAVVEVVDTGPGIPADELPHVFERFHRVDRSRSRRTGGAGLGLAIVKHLVEAQGGRVWVRSRPGEGSTFGFSLPRDPA